MGQIIGSAAKPKRCNMNQLSQVPTPAAGEYILVSSDNSMNAAGQGNFDAYVVGDGTAAATALPLKFCTSDIEMQTKNIELLGFSLLSYTILDTGKWGTANTYKHIIIPVNVGDRFELTASSTNTGYYAFLTSDSVSSGEDAPLVSGTSRVGVPALSKTIITIPETCVYLYIYSGATTSNTREALPRSLYLLGSAIGNIQKNIQGIQDTYKILDASVILPDDDLVEEIVNLEAITAAELSFTKDDKWTSGSHKNIDVFDTARALITTGNDDVEIVIVNTLWAERDTYNINNVLRHFTIPKNSSVYVSIPTEASALYYNTSAAPTAITLYKRTDTLVKNVGFRRMYPTGGVFTLNTNLRYYGATFKLKKDVTYLVEWDCSLTNATLYYAYLDRQPALGVSVVESSTTINNVNQKQAFRYKANNNGYLYVYTYSASTITYSMSVRVLSNLVDFSSRNVSLDNTLDIAENTIKNALFVSQNKDAFTVRSTRIHPATLNLDTSTSQKHILIPVTGNQIFKYIGNGTNASYFAFLTDVLGNEIPFLSGYNYLLILGSTDERVIRIPEGTKYLYVYLGSSSAHNNWPKYLGLTIDYSVLSDVVKQNDVVETKRILEQITSTTRAENDLETPVKPLCLLHYSDLHGRKICQNRINDFSEYWSGYIDDVIQTGDILADKYDDTIPYGDVSSAEAIAENPCRKILSVIGNHDTKGTSSTSWHDNQGLNVYNKIIAPFVSYWNVTQPANADTNGYCFYYKDYPNSNVRMVVIDAFNTDASYISTQETWLANVLEDARISGMHILMASHFRLRSNELLKSPFTMLNAAIENPDSSGFNDSYKQIVSDFISNGGELICWITGHSHYDAISKTSDGQINICVGNAGRDYNNDFVLHITNSFIYSSPNDSKTFDLFNMITIDTYYRLITLFRIGSNWDKYGRYIKTTCINYRTGEIVSE